MKQIILGFVFTVFFVSVCFGADSGDLRLVWADEFNVDGWPSPVNWKYEYGFVRNKELQWYQPGNAYCEGGKLVIEGRREKIKNPYYDADSGDWTRNREFAEYSSSCLITRGLHKWKYGQIEVRARINTDLGMWPAIWTLGVDMPWPRCGEVDIMEYYRIDDKAHLLANVAWGRDERYTPEWDTVTKPFDGFLEKDAKWSEKFHIWRMVWDEKFIKLYLDDELMNETDLSKTINPDGSNPFKQEHYLLLNLAIGGHGGDPSETKFPVKYEIDYVRVYQKVKDIKNEN